jgi:hypothetical protein
MDDSIGKPIRSVFFMYEIQSYKGLRRSPIAHLFVVPMEGKEPNWQVEYP